MPVTLLGILQCADQALLKRLLWDYKPPVGGDSIIRIDVDGIGVIAWTMIPDDPPRKNGKPAISAA